MGAFDNKLVAANFTASLKGSTITGGCAKADAGAATVTAAGCEVGPGAATVAQALINVPRHGTNQITNLSR